AHMVDVGAKAETHRVAIASGEIRMLPATLRTVLAGKAGKGDVLGIARVAAIMAAKRTSELIPLCHPIAIGAIDVDLSPIDEGISISATVRTNDRTGVEMEALTAVAVGALTIYDMIKGTERGARIEAIMLDSKSGGKSGDWTAPTDGRSS
ncbi:MAG: cyclic pyranopterin monophosphate synthase, partial [Actinomycetota bacterium]|nr:cyclic pyranopterin monophosphate synthase [Actinomycetota bacterium]